MELEKFIKKCKKCKNNDQRIYFLMFDRYHYFECYKPYQNIKNIIKELINPNNVTFINSNEACIQETEFYLTHLDNIYKLKKLGYISLNS
jgi:hypothetical protein